jgi:hypothetical protein
VGPLSRYVSGFAWAVGSASRTTISLCRAQVEWQRSCGSNGTGHPPNCHTSDELAESGDTRSSGMGLDDLRWPAAGNAVALRAPSERLSGLLTGSWRGSCLYAAELSLTPRGC